MTTDDFRIDAEYEVQLLIARSLRNLVATFHPELRNLGSLVEISDVENAARKVMEDLSECNYALTIAALTFCLSYILIAYRVEKMRLEEQADPEPEPEHKHRKIGLA